MGTFPSSYIQVPPPPRVQNAPDMLHVAKGMLHQGLKVKKLNNFSNLKSVVSELCRVSLQVIERHRESSKLRIFS